jgi:hypothetical protein
MRGFHDWLRQRPFSLFILFGCSSVLMASDHLIHVSRLGGEGRGALKLNAMA